MDRFVLETLQSTGNGHRKSSANGNWQEEQKPHSRYATTVN